MTTTAELVRRAARPLVAARAAARSADPERHPMADLEPRRHLLDIPSFRRGQASSEHDG